MRWLERFRHRVGAGDKGGSAQASYMESSSLGPGAGLRNVVSSCQFCSLYSNLYKGLKKWIMLDPVSCPLSKDQAVFVLNAEGRNHATCECEKPSFLSI